jgi:hypothetical protein
MLNRQCCAARRMAADVRWAEEDEDAAALRIAARLSGAGVRSARAS